MTKVNYYSDILNKLDTFEKMSFNYDKNETVFLNNTRDLIAKYLKKKNMHDLYDFENTLYLDSQRKKMKQLSESYKIQHNNNLTNIKKIYQKYKHCNSLFINELYLSLKKKKNKTILNEKISLNENYLNKFTN